jgi:hypothetical protein
MALEKDERRKLKQTYNDARKRCENQNCPIYSYYGGRGIEFRFTSFEEFYEELGSKPDPTYSLDRIDNNGHYEVGNVRWASKSEQVANRRKFKRPNQTNEHKAKAYLVTDDEGESIIVKNLTAFCKDNDLDVGNLHATIEGICRKTHKGFRAEVY